MSAACSQYPTLGGTSDDQLVLVVRTTNSSNVVTAPDAAPTYKIYSPVSPTEVLTSGTLSNWHTGTVSGAANNGSGLIRITTSAAHGLQTGDRVTISGVGGTTEANATWTITYQSSTTFDLQGSTFSNAFTSNGTFNVLGLLGAQVSITSGGGYEAGKTYIIVVSYLITSAFSRVLSFVVA